jgi:hypothetical protein
MEVCHRSTQITAGFGLLGEIKITIRIAITGQSYSLAHGQHYGTGDGICAGHGGPFFCNAKRL